ncbi:MAG: pyruvate kinase [Bdellovibrionales bacterium]|nr:pyruvate kinase [Bdellovibrionales bacterium]
MRRVKIVATIGPSTESEEGIEQAILSGMNVARLNFSHGDHSQHLAVIKNIEKMSDKLSLPVAILQDLQGPKIRVGKFSEGFIELQKSEIVEISPDFKLGEKGKIPTDFDKMPDSCKPDQKILLDDGLLELKVLKVVKNAIHAEVVHGGILKDRKGINLPGANLPVDCLTHKDVEDLNFGLEQNVDYVALSFVRSASDIIHLKDIIQQKNKSTKVIAKIEMAEAIDNLEEIVKVSDAIMVARGDLAVEVGQTVLPQLQKAIIRLANQYSKPVITATQMLDSMVNNPRPTRAEITDVANAVLDGSDALMLSAESASGKYPFICIQTMNDIILEVEKNDSNYYKMDLPDQFDSQSQAIAASACITAQRLNARYIICLSTTGKTATQIASFRPKANVIAVTRHQFGLNRMQLVWGVRVLYINSYSSSDEAMAQVKEILSNEDQLTKGDKLVFTLGLPVAEKAKTNSLRVYEY